MVGLYQEDGLIATSHDLCNMQTLHVACRMCLTSVLVGLRLAQLRSLRMLVQRLQPRQAPTVGIARQNASGHGLNTVSKVHVRVPAYFRREHQHCI